MFDFLAKKFSAAFARISGNDRLTETNIAAALESVKEALIEADVPYALAQEFVAAVQKEAVGKKVLASVKPGEQFIKLVHDQLVSFMGSSETATFEFPAAGVVIVMGLQGSGKTTSIAKLVHWTKRQAANKKEKQRALVASVDFYRPAAIDQLKLLADRVDVPFYRANQTDPIGAAREILEYYKKEKFDLLLLDTAGRLHVDDAMMAELQNIVTLVAPRYKFLVLDSMTGQESLNVAQCFQNAIGFDGAMLTKVDSDTKGGAAFAFRYALKKPIIFVGSGEKIDDIELFKADRAAGRILGMGDVLSLVEKAQDKVKQEEQDAMERSLRSGRMTLDDFAAQLEMVSKIGSLGSLMKYMPGMGQISISPAQIEAAELEMKKFKAAMSSMTRKERQNPKILDESRKKRIAKGAGIDLKTVTLLLDRFEQSQQYVKLLKKFGRF